MSLPGSDHLLRGKECQDACRADSFGRQLVLVAADGKGSADRPAEGAAIAAGVALVAARERLRVLDDPDHAAIKLLLQQVVEETCARVRATAEAVGAEAQSLATTLTLVVGVPPWWGAVRVGDGLVAVRLGNSGEEQHYGLLLPPPFRPVGQETSETLFLTSPDISRSLARSEEHALEAHVSSAVVHDPAITGVLVATDGLQGAAVSRHRTHIAAFPKFLAPLFDAADEDDMLAIAELLLLGSTVGRTSGDDKTAVTAVRTVCQRDG